MMKEDVLDNLHLFHAKGDDEGPPLETPERRYAVNLIIDNVDEHHAPLVIESNPTYENLFGKIEYRSVGNGLATDFTLVRPGALHRANGGILILRAEAIAQNPDTWEFLKGAIRDREIRIEERYREGNVPIAGAPSPSPIPLDVKVVIVGSPRWYGAFFTLDPDFRTHFKVKADIDAVMDADTHNLATYAALLKRSAAQRDIAIEPEAVGLLLGHASRLAGDRRRLAARFELVDDIIAEAAVNASKNGGKVTRLLVEAAIRAKLRRNSRVEERMLEQVERGLQLISVTGAEPGQVNALTVLELGDHEFGNASRITARASIGRRGVVNVERDVEMSGPIQQKGVMVLQGWLSGTFARSMPLSFNCSVTFEQNYGGVEGDSASLAELVAIISDLSGLPVRQDLAITGSVNQRGVAQAVGGVHLKVEGFFKTCQKLGGLTGSQGVVLPSSNVPSLVVSQEVEDAVRDGRFHLHSVDTIRDALEIFLGKPVGEPDREGKYPHDTVFGRVQETLKGFDDALRQRSVLPAD